MKRRTGLETHPLNSVGTCREAGDIEAVPLEVGLAGPRGVRGDAEMVIAPAPSGDDVGWFVALTEAGGCLRVVWGREPGELVSQLPEIGPAVHPVEVSVLIRLTFAAQPVVEVTGRLVIRFREERHRLQP